MKFSCEHGSIKDKIMNTSKRILNSWKCKSSPLEIYSLWSREMKKLEIIKALSEIIENLMLQNMTDQSYYSRKEIKTMIEDLIDKINQ